MDSLEAIRASNRATPKDQVRYKYSLRCRAPARNSKKPTFAQSRRRGSPGRRSEPVLVVCRRGRRPERAHHRFRVAAGPHQRKLVPLQPRNVSANDRCACLCVHYQAQTSVLYVRGFSFRGSGIFDRDGSGTIDIQEFQQLWAYINQWKGVFDRYDRDRSGNIDANELFTGMTIFNQILADGMCYLVYESYYVDRRETRSPA